VQTGSMWGLQAIRSDSFRSVFGCESRAAVTGDGSRKPDNENAMANLSLFQECLPTEIGRLIMLTDDRIACARSTGRTMARACIDCFACTTVPAG
jgi:hypothetical protein